ncbi:flavodoxin [Clostridium sp. BJN0001]|uniref:flavodoxin family protein n=1 Tax=Clostridium sp. BJN0001 TaxID=2930219 RepID=UPI001FD4CF6F|nr:flavodoxin [Clostridium sp. BJN0001]
MKSIVVYYSVSGQTKLVSEMISKKLECDILEITTKKEIPSDPLFRYLKGIKSILFKKENILNEYNFNSNTYDRIILGFPNWASNCPPAMKEFIKENDFNDKDIYLFTTYVARGGDSCVRNVSKNFNHSQVKKMAKFSIPSKKSEKYINNILDKFLEE